MIATANNSSLKPWRNTDLVQHGIRKDDFDVDLANFTHLMEQTKLAYSHGDAITTYRCMDLAIRIQHRHGFRGDSDFWEIVVEAYIARSLDAKKQKNFKAAWDFINTAEKIARFIRLDKNLVPKIRDAKLEVMSRASVRKLCEELQSALVYAQECANSGSERSMSRAIANAGKIAWKLGIDINQKAKKISKSLKFGDHVIETSEIRRLNEQIKRREARAALGIKFGVHYIQHHRTLRIFVKYEHCTPEIEAILTSSCLWEGIIDDTGIAFAWEFNRSDGMKAIATLNKFPAKWVNVNEFWPKNQPAAVPVPAA